VSRTSLAIGVCLAAALAVAPRAGRAQSAAGFAVDRFEPSGAGSRFLSLESLDFDGHLRAGAGVVSAWAWKPLVVYDGQGEVSALVSQQLVEHLQASLLAWNRARFDLDLPVPLVRQGSDAIIGAQTYAAPNGGAIGDLRLGADVMLFRQGDAFVGAIGAQLFLPTGSKDAFSSDGGVRFWPRLLVAGRHDRLSWAGRLGVHLRPQHACGCDLSPGSELTAGLAGGWWFMPRLMAGPELYLSRVISGGPFGARAATSLELMLSARFVASPRWNISLGVAPGLTDGAGTPAARVVLGVQYVVESLARRAWSAPEEPPVTIEPPASTEVVP
jgi:OOP family OmpA-OmpF porin